MPDVQAPVVLIPARPPQRRLRNTSCWSRSVLESLSSDGCHETSEALRGPPVLLDLVELLVDERALVSAFGTELRHRRDERIPHVGGWWTELRIFNRHSSIVALTLQRRDQFWPFAVDGLPLGKPTTARSTNEDGDRGRRVRRNGERRAVLK